MTEKYKRLLAQLKHLATELHEIYGGQPASRGELSEVKVHLKSLNNTIRALFEELDEKIEGIEARVFDLEEEPKS